MHNRTSSRSRAVRPTRRTSHRSNPRSLHTSSRQTQSQQRQPRRTPPSQRLSRLTAHLSPTHIQSHAKYSALALSTPLFSTVARSVLPSASSSFRHNNFQSIALAQLDNIEAKFNSILRFSKDQQSNKQSENNNDNNNNDSNDSGAPSSEGGDEKKDKKNTPNDSKKDDKDSTDKKPDTTKKPDSTTATPPKKSPESLDDFFQKAKKDWGTRNKLDDLKKSLQNDDDDDMKKKGKTFIRVTCVLLGLLVLAQAFEVAAWSRDRIMRQQTTYHQFLEQYLSTNNIDHLELKGNTALVYAADPKSSSPAAAFDVLSSSDFAARLAMDSQRFGVSAPTVSIHSLTLAETLGHAAHFVIITSFIISIASAMMSASSMLSKLPRLGGARRDGTSKITMEKDITTRFSDVAGMNEAKDEIVEFVHFLKSPEKYTKLGARLPKGALLSGPPGTGKTLLAKATAGEAGVPFFSMSGSEFQQMYVGVGAKRVRELFAAARKNAPSIIFIDEIDAIAKHRSSRGQGSGEREATLNQLLVEMDGFNNSPVVVFAATNRAELLDSAITRAGRFDRKIKVDAPDLTGREQIFNVHLEKLVLAHPAAEIAKKVAALTPGMVGADIANVCNEAAINAARRDATQVELNDFERAVDRVLGGLEKKNDLSDPKQRKIVAYHEAGHAIIGWFLQYTDPLLKVTIVPRTDGALGFAQYLPKEDALRQVEHLNDMIAMALGGRAAEDVMFGTVSTGASDDLRKVARIAQGMITRYGMSNNYANTAFITLDEDSEHYYQSISQKTAAKIDEEVLSMVDTQYRRAIDLLQSKRDILDKLGTALLEKETLNHDDLLLVLGERPFKDDAYVNYVTSRKEFDQDLLKEREANQAAADAAAAAAAAAATDAVVVVDDETTTTQDKTTTTSEEKPVEKGTDDKKD